MAYELENALYQWEEGERRLLAAPDRERAALDSAAELVLDELRRRLGSTFYVHELADFYAAGTDWATGLAARASPSSDAAYIVDAAFKRYAREAADYSGGRARAKRERP